MDIANVESTYSNNTFNQNSMMMHTSSTTQHSGTGNKATNPPVLVRKSTIEVKVGRKCK